MNRPNSVPTELADHVAALVGVSTSDAAWWLDGVIREMDKQLADNPNPTLKDCEAAVAPAIEKHHTAWGTFLQTVLGWAETNDPRFDQFANHIETLINTEHDNKN